LLKSRISQDFTQGARF